MGGYLYKLGASAVLVNFVSGFMFELMDTSLIESIRSSLTYLHNFQVLVVLP